MHQPRKRFGQNFLADRTVVDRIIAAIAPRAGERIVEIGPGLGALTRPLLAAANRLDAVEIDRDIVRNLGAQFRDEPLTLHQADALEFDFAALGRDLRIVGNLPYNISTPLLFHLTGSAPSIRDGHFMLQREVVSRMVAEPGTPDYGRLSVMLQYRWRMDRLFDVAPFAFEPQPKVWSTVVRMAPYAELPQKARDERLFAEVVTRAFGQRRKTLRNALRELLDADALASLGIDPGARGETLDVGQFVRIADSMAGRAGADPVSACAR